MTETHQDFCATEWASCSKGSSWPWSELSRGMYRQTSQMQGVCTTNLAQEGWAHISFFIHIQRVASLWASPLCSLAELWLWAQHKSRAGLLHRRCSPLHVLWCYEHLLHPVGTLQKCIRWMEVFDTSWVTSHTCSCQVMLPDGTDTVKEGELGWSLWPLPTAIGFTSITFSLNPRNVQNVSFTAVSWKVSGQARAVPSDDFHGLRWFIESIFCFNAFKK